MTTDLKQRGKDTAKHLLLFLEALLDVLIILGHMTYKAGQRTGRWVDEQRRVDINDLDIIIEEVNQEMGLSEGETETSYGVPGGLGEFNYGGDVIDGLAEELRVPTVREIFRRVTQPKEDATVDDDQSYVGYGEVHEMYTDDLEDLTDHKYVWADESLHQPDTDGDELPDEF